MNIYVDLGNTYCKFLLSENKDIFFQIKTSNLNLSFLKKMSKLKINKNKLLNIFISSVVPKKNVYLERFFKQTFSITPHFVDKNDFSNINCSLIKSNIGSDILVNSYLANSINKKNIIISLGTATVITFIEDAKIQGTFIMPGLMISYNALVSNAAKLKQLSIMKLKTSVLLGNDTNSSIYLGTVKGHFLQIVNLIQTIESTQDSKIFITGGNYVFLKDYFEKEFTYEHIDNMVLKGLKYLNKNN